MSKEACVFDSNMSETRQVEREADDGESLGAMQVNSLDGLTGLFASPAPSTAASMTETINSREEVQYCEEWELFSDDQHDVSGNDGRTEENSDEEIDQPGPCGVDGVDCELHLERSQPDDNGRQDTLSSNDNAERVSPSPSCTAASSITDDVDNSVPSLVTPSDRLPLVESARDSAVRRRLQVVVRVRPSVDSEDKVVVTKGEKEGFSLCVQATSAQGSISTMTECTFDRVFMGVATQEDVFAAVEPSVQACLEGYNATVFAYGQTGTGKTYTLFGRDLDSNDTMVGECDSFQEVKSSWGIIPRTLSYLLDQTAMLKQKKWHVELHLSFLQIYNDRLYDVLTDRLRHKPLLLREQPTVEGTTSVIVPGLSSERITSFSNAMQIIHQGHTNRCVRETESNLSSSRSHAIVQLHVTTQYPALNGEHQVLRRARLNLVDLAGSEKWNTEVGMEDAHSQELKTINTSLSALGNCIAALTETGRKHIPYRDSTLTRVLQDSFGGNTQSCLIATVNASQQSSDETIRTLHFADRARSVMQTIRVNDVAENSTELLMAKIQIGKLRERLESDQRRRLKEHQAMQRDFDEKLKRKDSEISKLTRENAVFQKWRDEDVKIIRALESRVKDLEQPRSSSDSHMTESLTDSVAQGLKRQSPAPPSIAAAKPIPVQNTRSRTNLIRVGSDNGTPARTYKQVLERYALGSSKGLERRTVQTSKIVFDQVQRNDQANDVSSQLEDAVEIQVAVRDMSSVMTQKLRREAPEDYRVPEMSRSDVNPFQTSGLCVSPVLYCLNGNAATATQPLSSTDSWASLKPTATTTTTSFSSQWVSSMLSSKSTPVILFQNQTNNSTLADPWSNANSGSSNFGTTSAVELCLKHKLAGCMLCSSVGASFRQSQAVPVRQELTTCTVTSKTIEVTRKPQDGACERHQLLRCFICANPSSTTSGTAQVSASAGYPYRVPLAQGETQAKCALHSLANCILCAGIKAMTRKVVGGPTPQASPAKAGGNHVEDHVVERYRRYTLDDRILHVDYQTQSKRANQ